MPKFVEIPVFTIGELSQKAQDKAHSDYLSCGFELDSTDNIDTIKSFCDLFCVTLKDWDISEYSCGYTAEIPKQRNLTKRKAIAMVNQWEITQGYFLASIACDAIKSGWYHGDIKYAIRNCLDEMFSACQRDLEYYYSVEYFIESCESMGWTFLESGDLFNV